MSKNTLTLDFDYDFGLISIVSSVKDYRLCWKINQTLRLDLSRKEDVEIQDTKKRKRAFFNMYEFDDVSNLTHYLLFANKSPGLFLIPELKQVDYFFMIHGSDLDDHTDEITRAIRKIDFVEALFVTDPNQLSSKHNLIFE